MSKSKIAWKPTLVAFVILTAVGLGLLEYSGVTQFRQTIPNQVERLSLPQVSLPEVRNAPVEIDVPESEVRTPKAAPEVGYWPEIHCKHFLFGYPTGTPQTNDLIIRDIYAMSNNDDTKFADWVAYRLDQKTITGESVSERDWESDPWLDESETLEEDDYDGAYAALNTDRGHQAPLASFKGTEYWADTNFLSNITPQKAPLNRGPWKELEDAVRNLVESKDDPVYIMTGPVYSEDSESLPGADEDHRVPSGYWKIVAMGELDRPKSVKAAAFFFPQETERGEDFADFQVSIREVEMRSGLNFFRDLPDDQEDDLESEIDDRWMRKNFAK